MSVYLKECQSIHDGRIKNECRVRMSKSSWWMNQKRMQSKNVKVFLAVESKTNANKVLCEYKTEMMREGTVLWEARLKLDVTISHKSQTRRTNECVV